MAKASLDKVKNEFQKLNSAEEKIQFFDEIKTFVMDEVERERTELEQKAEELKKFIQQP